MSAKSFVSIKFLNEKPTKKKLNRLNKILKRLDSDAPELDSNGFSGFWRKSYMLKNIMNLIHCYGYPVSYQYIHNAYKTYFNYYDLESRNPKNVIISFEEWIEANLSEAKIYFSESKSLDRDHSFYKIIRRLSRKF